MAENTSTDRRDFAAGAAFNCISLRLISNGDTTPNEHT
jgi:hypothetical protein